MSALAADPGTARHSRDKVSTDNYISVPLVNSLKNLVGQSRHGQFYRGIIGRVDNQFALI